MPTTLEHTMPFVGDTDTLHELVDHLRYEIATYGRLLGRCVNGTSADDEWARDYYLGQLGELVARLDRLSAEADRRRAAYWMARPSSPYAPGAMAVTKAVAA